MRASRVFRTIGRINSVLLLAVLSIGGMILAVILGEELLRSLRHHGAPEVHAAAEAKGDGEERLDYQPLVSIAGTPVTVLPLGGVQEADSLSSKAYAGTWTRNLLFHDGASGKMHWLRNDDRAAIGSWEVVRERDDERGQARAIRYEIADADTNGDGEISPYDRLQLGLSSPGGEGYVAVLRDVDEIRGYSSQVGGRFFVFFRRQEKELVAEIDLQARRLLREVPLPAR